MTTDRIACRRALSKERFLRNYYVILIHDVLIVLSFYEEQFRHVKGQSVDEPSASIQVGGNCSLRQIGDVEDSDGIALVLFHELSVFIALGRWSTMPEKETVILRQHD